MFNYHFLSLFSSFLSFLFLSHGIGRPLLLLLLLLERRRPGLVRRLRQVGPGGVFPKQQPGDDDGDDPVPSIASSPSLVPLLVSAPETVFSYAHAAAADARAHVTHVLGGEGRA